MQILDPKHPFFKPLWRRILTVLLPAVWGGVELYNNAMGWAVVFLGASAFAAYELLFMYGHTIAKAKAAEEAAKARQEDEGDDDDGPATQTGGQDR